MAALQPTITALTFPSIDGGLPTTGGSGTSGILIAGTGLYNPTLSFGPSSNPNRFTVSCTTPTGETGTMTCGSPIGSGFSTDCGARLTNQGGAISSVFNCSSYTFAPPIINNYGLYGFESISTSGGSLVSVVGKHFGPSGTGVTPVTARFGPTGTEFTMTSCEVVEDDMIVACVAPPLGGKNYVFQLEVNGLVTDIYSMDLISYAFALASLIMPRTLPTAGCDLCVTITGTNFLTPAARDAGFIQRAAISNQDGGASLITDIVCAIVSDTSTLCNAPVAVGTNYQYLFQIGYATWFDDPLMSVYIRNTEYYTSPEALQTFNYMQPTIASIYPSALNNVGTTKLTITGSQYGPPFTMITNPMLSNGVTTYTLTSCQVVIPNTAITCVVPDGGSGNNFLVGFAIGGQPVINNITVSYPTIDSVYTTTISSTTMTTDGTTVITIIGTRFGGQLGDALPTAVLFNAGTGVTYAMVCQIGTYNPTTGISSMTCVSPIGVGTDYRVRVLLPSGNNVTSSVYQTLSYATPIITAITNTPGVSPATGGAGETITLRGDNYGNGPVTSASLINGDNVGGRSYAMSCTVQNPTTIWCTLPTGGGTHHQVYVVIGGQQVYSDVSQGLVVDYAAPGYVTSVAVRLNGGLTLHGNNFGDPVSVVLQNGDGTNGQDIDLGTCTASSAEIVTCATVGAGINWQVSMTVGGQTTLTTGYRFNYPPPVIEDISHAYPVEGATVDITGEYFGNPLIQVSYSSVVSVTLVNGTGVGNLTFAMTSCMITSSTTIRCIMPFAVGANHALSLMVAGQYAPQNNDVTLSYAVPIVASVSTSAAATPMSTTGGATVTITGSNMGSVAMQAVYPELCTASLMDVNNVPFAMSSCTLQSTTEIWCVAGAGLGSQNHVVLTCGGQSSLPSVDTVAYAAPIITDITPTGVSLPTDGVGGTWTITGDNFGVPSLSSLSSVRLINGDNIGVAGFSLQGSCVIQSSTEIHCSQPAGVGAGYTLELTLSDQSVDSSTLSGHPVWSYDPPTITSLAVPSPSLPTAGGMTITIIGTNMGPNDLTDITGLVTAKLVNGQGTTGITYQMTMTSCSIQSQTVIWCVSSVGVGYDHQLQLSVGGQTVTTTSPLLLRYTPPEIISIRPNYGARDGDTTITINATNVGTPGHILIDGSTPAAFVAYTPTSANGVITASATPATASSSDISLVVGGQSSLSVTFSYYDFNVLNAMIPVRGGWNVTVTGKGFTATMEYTYAFMVDVSPSAIRQPGGYVSPTTLTFIAPPCSPDAMYAGDTIGVSASLNGVDQPYVFVGLITYYPVPIITTIAPLQGPIQGGTILTINGLFPDTGVIWGRIGNGTSSLYPPTGVMELACSRHATIPSSIIYCTTSAQTFASMYESISISVDVNSDDRVYTLAIYQYQAYIPPSILTLDPPLVATTSNDDVSVLLILSGDHMIIPVGTPLLSVRIASTSVITTGVSFTPNMIRCNVPAAILSSLAPGEYNVALSYNGQSYSDSSDNNVYLTVYDQPQLVSIAPTSVSNQGGDLVNITGTGFINTSLCQIQLFATQPSSSVMLVATLPCTYLSPTTVQFTSTVVSSTVAPPEGVTVHAIVAINGQQYTSLVDNYASLVIYDIPQVTAITPTSAPFRGATNVSFTGVFANTGYVRARFGAQLSSSPSVACVYHTVTRVTCLTPSWASFVNSAQRMHVFVSVDYPNGDEDASGYHWSTSVIVFGYTNETIAGVTPSMVLSGVSPTDTTVNGHVQMDLTLSEPIVDARATEAMIRLVNGTAATNDDATMTLDYATNVHGFQYYSDIKLESSSSAALPFSSSQWTFMKLAAATSIPTVVDVGRLRDDCSDLRLMIHRSWVNVTVLAAMDMDTISNSKNEWMDLPFVTIGCQTSSMTLWYQLPPLTSIALQSASISIRIFYSDPLMTPANAAHYTSSYASRVWDAWDDFTTMKPNQWLYQTDAHTTAFFNPTHGLVYQSDNDQMKNPTRRVETIASPSFVMIVTGERWLDGDPPLNLSRTTTDYVQPYIQLTPLSSGEGTRIPYITDTSSATGYLFTMARDGGTCSSATGITRRWWLVVSCVNGAITITTDQCDAVGTSATAPYSAVSFGIHQSTGRRSSIDGFYLKQFGTATAFPYDQVASYAPILTLAATIISAMLPYQLVARANVVVQLSLNGQDWPLSYDVSTNNDVTHQLVTIDIIDSSIMDHIIDITPATAPFDSVIAGSITFDSTVTSSSVFNKSSVALRLSSLDQFMTLSPSVASSSGNNVYNWSFDGSIPSSYNMDNILGTHPLQLQLTRSNDQQIMTGSSSSSSSFTKTARPPCGLCATTAQQVFTDLSAAAQIEINQIVPITEPLSVILTSFMIQQSHLWWTTLEPGLVSTECGSPRLGHGTSWLFGSKSTHSERVLESYVVDLRLAPAVLTFYVRFGLLDDGIEPNCGLNTPLTGSQLASASLDVQWTNNGGATYRTIATILPTEDNEWHYHRITLPSWTQSHGDDTRLRLYQVPMVAESVMAIQDIGVYTYAPTQPSFIVTSFSPSTNISAAGGVVITITGSGFSQIGVTVLEADTIVRAGAIMCSFGGRPAMNVIRVSDTMALCTTPSIAWSNATLTYETTFDVCGATFVGISEAQKTISFIGCNIGTYSSYNDGSCVLCALGSYSNTINTIDECHLCVAGRFGNVTGETSPLCTDLCFEGYYCPEGSSSGAEKSCPIHSTSPRGSSSLSDCVCEDGYSLSVTGAECSACSSLIGFSSDDGYVTCSGIRMTWATLHDISSATAVAPHHNGTLTLTSLTNNIVQFNISGNIRVIHATSSSSSSSSASSSDTMRRLLAGNGDDESDITNVNANDDSVAIMVRFGHSATLSSSLTSLTLTSSANAAVFASLSICDTITTVVDYSSWTTLVTCSLPYGIANNLSFSLWQYNSDNVPILISYDGQVIVAGVRIADTFAYPAPVITAGTIRQATLPLSTRSTSLLASSTTLSESIAFEGQFFDPTSMIVRYGVKGNTYACTIDIAQTTSTMVVCNTPANLISVTNDPLIFSIQQGGYMVYGKDTYRYPLVPIITRIWGCDGTSFSPLSTTTMGCPTFGNITITMCGSNWENTNLQAFVNGVECTHAYAFNATIDPSEVVNNSSQSITVLCPILLTCILPVGAGADQGVTVSSKGQFSPAAKLVSYSPPVITRVIGCPNGDGTNCNRFGGDRLTIIGNNFGPASPSVLIGSASCTNLQWTNHSYVTCDIPSGSGNDRSVILLQVNGDISSSSAATISYQPCDGGKQPDGLNCTSCSPGYYSSSGVECIACGPGRYAPNMSMDDCVSVPEGTFQGGYGQSVAIVCDDGESAPSPGLSQCLSCSAGKWSYGNDSASKVNCLPCDVGTYSDGTRPCEPCPELTFATTPGSQSRSKCSGSTYLLMHSPSHIDCLPCPSGVLCQDGIIQSNTQYYLAPQNDGSYRSLVCLPGLCRACNNSNVKAQLTNCCGDGRIQTNNPMCALCEDGLIEVGDGTKCQKCDASSGGLVFLFLFVTFVFLFIFHRTSQSSGKTSDAQQLLYFIQMLIIFFGPESGWISWLSFINLNMLAAGGSSCVVPLSPLGRLLSGIVIPAVGLAELAFVFLLDFGLWTWWKKKLRGYDHKYISWLLPKTRTFKSSPIRRTLVVYYLISYTSIATAVLQYFTCLTVSETKSVLQAYPAVSCQDDSYKSVNGFMWFICITFVVISPLVMLGALIWNHIKGRLSQVKHTQRYGPLYEHFRPSRYWWSFVTIVRRVILITLVSQLGYDRPLMFSWVTFTNILMLLIHMIALPYESVAGNNIETGLLTLHAIVTTLMTTLPFPLNSKQAAGISVLVFVPTIIFILYMIQTRTHHIIRERLSRISRYSRGSRTSSKRFSSSTAAAIQHEQQHKHVELPSPLPSLASSSSSLPSTGAVTLEVQNDDGSAVATAVV